MELELVTEGVGEEYSFGADDIDNGYPTFEGETCGICMDIVIDRGVLDCCQHWFCFACIDNWATITNLCPLCQNEFQMITCVPVYDTIGSSQPDEDSYSRDDDWCVEGKNNTLSFPSYYIDENAVICLEGDACKIRSVSATIEEDSNLDTSIACDSCDIWCLVDKTPQISAGVPVLGPSNQHDPENECLVEATFPRKVSVSVADAGETAVVVSMVEENQKTEVPSEESLLSLNVSKDLESGMSKLCSGADDCKLETVSQVSVSVADPGETVAVVSMRDENQGNEEPSKKFLPSLDLCKDMEIDKAISEPSVSDGLRTSRKFDVEHYNNEPLESGLDLHVGLSVASSLSEVKNMNNHLAKDRVAGEVQQKNGSKECGLPADKALPDKKEYAVGNRCAKRKHRDYRSAENGETKAQKQNNVSAKKVKAERSSQLVRSKDQADESVSDDSQNFTSLEAASEDDMLRCTSGKENATTDISFIVQGTCHRPKSSKERENAARLRVKKIMRRATEDKKSSMVVQELRKEIRDAIRKKSSKEISDNVFDPKLLAAFRAAVAGPSTETKKLPPLDLKAKMSLLQKGKVRENLTKKIYGIGGRRKRAWTRDCEIEFWKHHCLKVTKPEKIKTLKSVLNLLRKSPETTEIKQENYVGSTSSILSRLYLADASVFPRKDDIKPLSALKAAGIAEQNKDCTSMEKTSIPSLSDSCARTPQMHEFSAQFSVPSVDSKGTKCNVPSNKREAASSKVNPNKGPEDSSNSTSGGSPVNSRKEMVGKSDNIKIDKRKWALEVLARKTAVSGKNAAQGQEDNIVLKGNYPLLAQLPLDMRPVLAPSRHNKIPISIRQAQLYRLTEHFLRKTNLPVTRRTAEIELAVADAVNIEKEVADRSNSKLVYVNLCSQELLHRSDNIICARASDSTPPSAVPSDRSEEVSTHNLSSGLEVDEALRNAGLLSDSPPNSPYHQMEETKEEVDLSEKIKEEGPDNVFETDSQPELDIYGDFEYDLEDEDFIGASALKISNLQQEESKIKVVFSTLDSDKSNGVWNFEDREAPATVEVTNVNNLTDRCLSQDSLLEGGEEPMLGECEELYGPDKEPLLKKFPEMTSIKPFELVTNNIAPGENEGKGSNLAAKASELQTESCLENLVVTNVVHHSSGGEDSPNRPQETVTTKEKKSHGDIKHHSDRHSSVFKKVEAYIKEHIRPLCKSGVITAEQYRWAVGKTTDKIMKYHSKDTNANFLIKEGEKVKKLAEQYVEAAQKVGKANR